MACNLSRDRKAILKAAYEQLCVGGYRGLLMKQLIDPSGQRFGNIYNHFRTKEDLVLAVLQEVVKARIVVDWIAPIRRGASFRKGLWDCIRANADHEKMVFDPVVLIVSLCNATDSPAVRAAATEILSIWRRILENEIRCAMRAGELRGDSAPRALASVLVHGILGILFTPLPEGRQDVDERLLAFRHLLRGILRKQSPPSP